MALASNHFIPQHPIAIKYRSFLRSKELVKSPFSRLDVEPKKIKRLNVLTAIFKK